MIEKSQFMKFPWNYGKLTFRRKMQKFSWICLRSINHHCGSKEHVLKHVLRPYHFHEKIWDWKTFLNFFNFCGVPNHFVESPKTEKWESLVNPLESPKTEKWESQVNPLESPKKRVESQVGVPPPQKKPRAGVGTQHWTLCWVIIICICKNILYSWRAATIHWTAAK